MEFTDEQKKLLFTLARESIERELFGKEKKTKIDIEQHPAFAAKCGVFVTLTIADQLRGCIGFITATTSLYTTVQEAAVSAAYNDPRFYPLTQTEYEQVNLEISVLSEPYPMGKYEDIEIGKHGLILEEKGRRGLLLPQVPIEHRMNREQFLNAICKKAGIPEDLWQKKRLDISLFTATVFSEKELEEKNATN